jgi:hypothetical protein
MRLSDAQLRRRQTEPLYANHRLPPTFNEDATRVRSNRLLDGALGLRLLIRIIGVTQLSRRKKH